MFHFNCTVKHGAISSMPINNKKILNRIFPDSGKNVSYIVFISLISYINCARKVAMNDASSKRNSW